MSLNTTPDSYTKLLIHSDTTDGSTTIVDSSATGHTPTNTGVTHQDTQQKFGATSLYFVDNGDYLTIPGNADWNFGTGDFTIDFWLYFISGVGTGNYMAVVTSEHTSSGARNWWISMGASGPAAPLLTFADYDNNVYPTAYDYRPHINKWAHIAFVRVGGVGTMYVDGNAVNATAMAGSIGNSTDPTYINRVPSNTSRHFAGYIDEFRISKGIARWTKNFTPPTRPYSIIDDQFHTDIDTISDREIVVGGVDSFTKLLIHSDTVSGSTTFIDSSPSSHTIYTGSYVRHTNDYAKFGASSMYFNGAGLTVSGSLSDFNFGTGNFTVDFWLYIPASDGFGFSTFIIANDFAGSQYWAVYDYASHSGRYLSYVSPGLSINLTTNPLSLDTWHHVAAVREGTGTNQTKLYVDGALKGQGTDTTDFSSNESVKIGNYLPSLTDRLSGSLDEIRVSNVVRWTDDFVPPKRQYGEKSVISAEGGVGIGTNIAREAFHVNSGQKRLYSVTADTTGSLFSVNDKDGNILLDVNSDGFVTKPKLPAFLVMPATTQANIGEGGQNSIVWGTVVFDQDNNFASNTFTAPVTGKYQLQASVRIDNIDTASDYYQLTLNTSNRTYPSVFLLDPGVLASDPAYWSAGFAILVDMDAGDTAYITFYQQDSGTVQTDINPDSWFSGYLVC